MSETGLLSLLKFILGHKYSSSWDGRTVGPGSDTFSHPERTCGSRSFGRRTNPIQSKLFVFTSTWKTISDASEGIRTSENKKFSGELVWILKQQMKRVDYCCRDWKTLTMWILLTRILLQLTKRICIKIFVTKSATQPKIIEKKKTRKYSTNCEEVDFW